MRGLRRPGPFREAHRFVAMLAPSVVLLTGFLPEGAKAQVSLDIVDLSVAAATSSDGFTWIEGVRELSDGRVILVDRGERFVYLLDSQLSRVGTIGGWGQGPGEYHLPFDIIALPGDSTGVFDMARQRFLVISPDGTPGDFIPPRADVLLRPDTRADGVGHLYARTAPVHRSPSGQHILVDSAAIERWRLDGQTPDTVAFVPVAIRPGTTVSVVGGRVGTPSPPGGMAFSAAPEWTVARDGTLAVVRPDPYQVELIAADGGRRWGPVVQHQPVPVTAGHREEWCDQQRVPVVSITRTLGQPDAYGVEVRTGPCSEPEGWPDIMPPFLPGGAVTFDPGGTLWIRRTTHAGASPTFDLFDSSATRVRQVRLPAAARLVGFGAESVYVVRRDQFDLEWLERIAIGPAP